MGLEFLGALAQLANQEHVGGSATGPGLLQGLVQPTLESLQTIVDDPELPDDAADAERHQEAAGLSGRLSAAELQRLVVLLHTRCAHHAALKLAEAPAQPARELQMLLLCLAGLDRLAALEPGRPFDLRWKGFVLAKMERHGPAAASLEAALAACDSRPGAERLHALQDSCVSRGASSAAVSRPAHLLLSLAALRLLPAASMVESAAARLLAEQLMVGGGGSHWSQARVRSLLDRAAAALARCKAWLPTPAYSWQKDLLKRAQAMAAGAAAVGGSPDIQPAGFSKGIQLPRGVHCITPACGACGKRSLQSKKCSACRSVSYW